jgi:hypothetical protein
MPAQSAADLIMDILHSVGVRQIYGIVGDSLNFDCHWSQSGEAGPCRGGTSVRGSTGALTAYTYFRLVLNGDTE